MARNGVSLAAQAVATWGCEDGLAYGFLQQAYTLHVQRLLPVQCDMRHADTQAYRQAMRGLAAAHAIGKALRRMAGTPAPMPRPLA